MARTLASENNQQSSLPRPFRGHCLYKTGKCQEERALKTNGLPHNLCNYHRWKQNHNQRKLDSKLRRNAKKQSVDSDQTEHPVQIPTPYSYVPHPQYMIPPSYQLNRDTYRAHVLKQLVQLVSEEILATEARFAPIVPDPTQDLPWHNTRLFTRDFRSPYQN